MDSPMLTGDQVRQLELFLVATKRRNDLEELRYLEGSAQAMLNSPDTHFEALEGILRQCDKIRRRLWPAIPDFGLRREVDRAPRPDYDPEDVDRHLEDNPRFPA